MSEWQPIETAPKDGTPILTFSEDAAKEGYHQLLNGVPAPTMQVMAFCMGGFDMLDEHGDLLCAACYDPTHWMPLPEPPQ